MDAFKSSAHMSVRESKIPGSRSLGHHYDATGVAASFQSRYATPTTHTKLFTKASPDSYTIRLNSHNCSPDSAAPDRCNLNRSILRTVVVVWKRTMHALCRRESSRDSPRGVLTYSGFVMTTLRSRKTPLNTSESGTGGEALLAGDVNNDSGSAWSLV